MLRPHADDITPLDRIVYDPRFYPYSGWHDDHRDAVGPAYKAAMFQIRSEFHAFADMLAQRRIRGRCLQLGLDSGASHMVFKQLFEDVWTVEPEQQSINDLVIAIGPVDTIVSGHSYDPTVLAKVREFGRFDLLFIDGDHRLDNVRADFYDYGPLVRHGGLIALHDAWPAVNENGVWRFLDILRSTGYNVSTIGDELGIAWVLRGDRLP